MRRPASTYLESDTSALHLGVRRGAQTGASGLSVPARTLAALVAPGARDRDHARHLRHRPTLAPRGAVAARVAGHRLLVRGPRVRGARDTPWRDRAQPAPPARHRLVCLRAVRALAASLDRLAQS